MNKRNGRCLQMILATLALAWLSAAGCVSTQPVAAPAVPAAAAPAVAEPSAPPAAALAEAPPAPEAAPAAATAVAERLEPRPLPPLHDPLEPVNRAFFEFNDRLYFWVLKPVARGYGYVMPERGRVWVRNFFTNLGMPGRAINSTLQMDFRGGGTELSRFLINSTIGVAGFGDPAGQRWHIRPREADTGQTLGYYGMPPWIYLNWPILGPSCPRDTVGFIADSYLDPITWFVPDLPPRLGIKAGDRVNRTSLRLGEYEDMKDAALDPYIALRDIYYQYREPQMRWDRAAADDAGAGAPPLE